MVRVEKRGWKKMEIINSLIDFFGLAPEILTFTDFCIWFVKMLLAFMIIGTVLNALFTATWKIERSLR